MSEDKKLMPLAHLRFLDWNNHCTLSFKFQMLETERYNTINENVVAIRQMSEAVHALLSHTTNKIHKVLQDALKEDHDKENQKGHSIPDLDISLRTRSKQVHTGTELKLLQRFKNLTFTLLGTTYNVVLNAPLVENIKLPDVIYSGHSVQPSLFKATLANHEKSEYFWSKSMDKEEWEKIGDEYHYTVKEDDIDHYIKFTYNPVNIYSAGDPYEVISTCKVCRVPTVPYCPFQDRHKETSNFLMDHQFRVVSYNTLSCRYANDQFAYCPIQYLAIDYRKQLLLKEMFGYHADVICCQEVDNKIYGFYFRPEFEKINYGSIYNKKGNRIPEGLAIFYNKNRFKFAGQGHIVFNSELKTNRNLRNISKIIDSDNEAFESFMKQPSSMQYLLLKSRNSNQTLIVANTHLYYHPDANNVRLLQAAVCIEYLKMIYQREMKKKSDVSLIFCGDFNSKPDSQVFKFVTEGAIQYSSRSTGTSLFHPFQFTSACGAPEFTNYVEDFKACLDYIFHVNLTTIKDIPLPDEEVLAKDTALPSRVFPSDHLALVADLQFK